jgi:hypothetical protein
MANAANHQWPKLMQQATDEDKPPRATAEPAIRVTPRTLRERAEQLLCNAVKTDCA